MQEILPSKGKISCSENEGIAAWLSFEPKKSPL
jgi:hypothetical protein